MQTTIKRRFKNCFTMIPNTILNHQNLSLKAKGLCAYLLSKPDDWIFKKRVILNELKEGIDAFNSTIKELVDSGFLTKTLIRGDDGQFSGTEYTIYDEPQIVTQDMEQPHVENPSMVNPPIYNNTKDSNTKNIKNIDTKEKIYKKENDCEDLSFKNLVDSVKEIEPTLSAKTRNIERKIKEIDDVLSKIGMQLPNYINKPLLVTVFVFAKDKILTTNAFLQDIKNIQDLHNNGADIEKCLQECLVHRWRSVRYEYFADNRGQIKPSFLVSNVLYDGRGANYGQVAKAWGGTTKAQAIDPNQAFKDLCTFGSESK